MLTSAARETLAGVETVIIDEIYALAATLRDRLVFDGRNLYDPATVRGLGFEYYPIGRP